MAYSRRPGQRPGPRRSGAGRPAGKSGRPRAERSAEEAPERAPSRPGARRSARPGERPLERRGGRPTGRESSARPGLRNRTIGRAEEDATERPSPRQGKSGGASRARSTERPLRNRPTSGKPRGRSAGKAGASSRRSRAALEVRWEALRPLYDFWGNKIPRYYRLESLTRAVEGLIHGRDKFIAPSVHAMAGPSPVVSMAFELFQEGQYQLIFLLKATNERRKRVMLGFVVAKRPGDFSKLAAQEHENLRMLHGRAPEHIVRPFHGGRILLQDRRLGPGRTWEIYAYLTQWLPSYHELGVAQNLQFYVNVKQPQLFTVDETEHLKGQMVEIVAKSFSPEHRDCMEMPQIASGDFVVTKPTQAKPRLKLIACRRMLRNMTPAKVLHRILSAEWDWGGKRFRLAPENPDTVLEGLTRALGADAARAWLQEYGAQLEKGAFPERPPLTLHALREMGILPRK
jgi:hypothetical protein